MRRGKYMYLLVAMLVATGLLFAGGEACAATFSYEVSFVSLSNASPATADYTYEFTQTPGSTTLSYVDLEIPVEISLPVGPFPAAGNANFTATLNGAGLSGEIYEIGIGDFGTKFGVGDTRYRVVKVNIPNPAPSFSIVLHIKNQSFTDGRTMAAGPGVVLIKAGNGSNTQSFTIDTPVVVAPPPPPAPFISLFSASPNPVVSGSPLTLAWSGTNIEYVMINNVKYTVSPAVVYPVNTDCVAITIQYFLMAYGPGGTNTFTTDVVVDPLPPPPLIETTCKQIRKNPVVGNPSCIALCLITIDGVQQDIFSATWFNNPDCDPNESPGIPLAVHGDDSPEKTLVCAPCIHDPTDPEHPQACTTNTDQSQTPFLYPQTVGSNTFYKNCDVFRFEKQDQGFAAVLGTDPWIVINGRQVWVR